MLVTSPRSRTFRVVACLLLFLLAVFSTLPHATSASVLSQTRSSLSRDTRSARNVPGTYNHTARAAKPLTSSEERSQPSLATSSSALADVPSGNGKGGVDAAIKSQTPEHDSSEPVIQLEEAEVFDLGKPPPKLDKEYRRLLRQARGGRRGGRRRRKKNRKNKKDKKKKRRDRRKKRRKNKRRKERKRKKADSTDDDFENDGYSVRVQIGEVGPYEGTRLSQPEIVAEIDGDANSKGTVQKPSHNATKDNMGASASSSNSQRVRNTENWTITNSNGGKDANGIPAQSGSTDGSSNQGNVDYGSVDATIPPPKKYWQEDVSLGCHELYTRRYITDGFCTSENPVKEVACHGTCLPIHDLPWYAEFVKTMSRKEINQYECTEGYTRKKRVVLICMDGKVRVYRIKIVLGCKCAKISEEANTSDAMTSPKRKKNQTTKTGRGKKKGRRKKKKKKRKGKRRRNDPSKNRNKRMDETTLYSRHYYAGSSKPQEYLDNFDHTNEKKREGGFYGPDGEPIPYIRSIEVVKERDYLESNEYS